MASKDLEWPGDDNHRESRKRKRHSQLDSDYEENDLEEIEKKARLTIEEALSKYIIKFCPSCKVRVVKGPGCNHITCVCGADFCFKCGDRRCDGKGYCRKRKRLGPTSVVRRVCKRLKQHHPQLTFRQCCRIVAKSWTEEHEALESERCDNDSECSGQE